MGKPCRTEKRRCHLQPEFLYEDGKRQCEHAPARKQQDRLQQRQQSQQWKVAQRSAEVLFDEQII
jgi:hypothetical protein